MRAEERTCVRQRGKTKLDTEMESLKGQIRSKRKSASAGQRKRATLKDCGSVSVEQHSHQEWTLALVFSPPHYPPLVGLCEVTLQSSRNMAAPACGCLQGIQNLQVLVMPWCVCARVYVCVGS